MRRRSGERNRGIKERALDALWDAELKAAPVVKGKDGPETLAVLLEVFMGLELREGEARSAGDPTFGQAEADVDGVLFWAEAGHSKLRAMLNCVCGRVFRSDVVSWETLGLLVKQFSDHRSECLWARLREGE